MALSFAQGGRRRAIETLAVRLRPLGVRCDLVCLDSLGHEPGDRDNPFGDVEVLGRRSTFDPRTLRRLLAFCRRREIDIVHTHDAEQWTFGAGALMRNLAKRKLI